MKKKTLLSIAGGIVLVILVILVVLLTRQRDSSIRIKTRLSPDEVVKKVELTSGALNFKSEKDVYAEQSAEEREALKPKPGDYSPKYDKHITVKEEDISRVLNIDPAKWRIPDRLECQYERFDTQIGFIGADAPDADYSDDVLYSREYRSEDGGFTVIEVALPGRRWIRNEELTVGGVSSSPQQVKAVYGSLDSRIGDMPLSVLNCEASSWDRDLEAYFIAGNAAYFIRSNVMTQQEFIELLISIYEAPRLVKEDAISALDAAAITKSAAPQENAETQSATLCIFKEPVIFGKSEIEPAKHVFFNRKHSAGIDEIDRLKSIVNSVGSWSTDAGDGDITVDGYFALSDEEYPFYYSCSSSVIFYETFSMDAETGKAADVVRHSAAVSEADMAYIQSLKDSKDGFVG